MVTWARRSVLVGIDSCDGAGSWASASTSESIGTRESIVAAETAAAEAHRLHLPLRLICCRYPGRDARRILERMIERLRERFPTLVMTAAACPATHRGALADVLVEDSRDADLVVVGPAHTGGYDSLLDRWLNHRVVTHSRCPVLVAHARTADGRGTAAERGPVLVGLDGSEHSDAAVPLAFEQAMLRGVPVRAVNVYIVHPEVASESAESDGYTARTARAWSADLLADSLDGWRDRYPEVAVVSEPLYAPDVASAFVAASASVPLVVVGCRGRTACTSLLPGSVSRALIHRARCPVLVAHGRARPNLHRTVVPGAGRATDGRSVRLATSPPPPATGLPGPRLPESHLPESQLAGSGLPGSQPPVGWYDEWTA